jgi:aromatic-L-amino-acid decarboxylase
MSSGRSDAKVFIVGVAVGAAAAAAVVAALQLRPKSKPSTDPALRSAEDEPGAGVGAEDGDDFQAAGRHLLQWIVSYREGTVRDRPVVSTVKPNYLAEMLPAEAPVNEEYWPDIFKDLDTAIVPGLTHWESSSKFFAYFKPHASYPAVLGEMLCAGLNVMGFDWIASPACTELEVVVCDWLAKFLHLPNKFLNLGEGPGGSVIQGSAGEAAIVAFLAALGAVQKNPPLLAGYGKASTARENMVVFASDQAHAIVKKACMVLGIGHCRIIETTETDRYALSPLALREAIEEELSLGRAPVAIVATTGTTSSCAFDPIEDIGRVAAEFSIWLHIDAAYGGAYACLPQLQHLFNGLEACDSFVVNCHKKLLCPFDISVLYVADRRPILDALSLQPEYLKNAASESGAVVDYEHWQLPLGRRFRALKLWFVFRRFGQKKMIQHLQQGLDLSEYFANMLTKCPEFELVVPISLSLVCFRLRNQPEEVQKELLDRVKATGDCFIIHTKLSGRIVLRFACGGIEQSREDVLRGWTVIKREAALLLQSR